MFINDLIMKRLYEHESCLHLHGRQYVVTIEACYSDWVCDLSDELDIELDDVVSALSELEAHGIIHLLMADPGDDFICGVEFTMPKSPNQLELF